MARIFPISHDISLLPLQCRCDWEGDWASQAHERNVLAEDIQPAELLQDCEQLNHLGLHCINEGEYGSHKEI